MTNARAHLFLFSMAFFCSKVFISLSLGSRVSFSVPRSRLAASIFACSDLGGLLEWKK